MLSTCEQGANRSLTAEEKLRQVLNTLTEDGSKLVRHAQNMVDKVDGPRPSGDSASPDVYPGDLHSLIDAIANNVQRVIASTANALHAAHERLGSFDMTKATTEAPSIRR